MKLGRLTRDAQKKLRALPGFSAAADLAVARNCVDLLTERLKRAPDDPRHHVWLAEAVATTRRDLRLWLRVRTTLDPTSLISRTALGRVARLGTDAPADPPETLLMRQAFALATARVRAGLGDARTLHVLARVYLAQDQPEHALRIAGAALQLHGDERADVLVTAARAFLRAGRREDAARAATEAIEHGSTVGYAVLARLRATDPNGLRAKPSDRVRDWNQLRRNVRREDRARYSGAARTPLQVANAARSAQWSKAATAVDDAVDFAARSTKELRS